MWRYVWKTCGGGNECTLIGAPLFCAFSLLKLREDQTQMNAGQMKQLAVLCLSELHFILKAETASQRWGKKHETDFKIMKIQIMFMNYKVFTNHLQSIIHTINNDVC